MPVTPRHARHPSCASSPFAPAACRTQLEASKNDMIKWFVGMMTSVFLVVASALRMLGKW